MTGVDDNGDSITNTINPYSSQGDFGIAIGEISVAHQNSIAIGENSDARARQGIAIGDGARSLPPGSGQSYDVASIAIGHNAIAAGENSISIGRASHSYMDRSIVIGHGIEAQLHDATYIQLREVVHDNMCFYNADTSEISYAPAPPRVFAAGSFAQDGTAINNVSYNCTCRSFTMVANKAKEYLREPFGFGQNPYHLPLPTVDSIGRNQGTTKSYSIYP